MAKAAAYAARATARDDSSDFAWRMRLVIDLQAKRYGPAIDTLERMTQGRGAALNSVPPKWLWQTRAVLDSAHDDVNLLRLLRIMSDSAYQPDDLGWEIDNSGDTARTTYARKLVGAGRKDEARALLVDLKGYGALDQVAFDPDLRALFGRPIDLRAVVEADLIQHRALMEKYPRSLAALNAVASDLRRLGRNDEMIAMLKAAISQAESTGAYDDRDDNLPWFWNSLAYAYAAAGKYDDMVVAFGKGAALNESGMPNVSQVINLSGQQNAFDRPKDALATITPISIKADASPYGLMQIHLARGCAYARLSDLANARADLAYLLAHEPDAPPAVSLIQMCLDNEDATAASFVRRLGDPRTREMAMRDLTDYDAPDPRGPISPIAPLFERVRKRSDVQAAIRAAGGPFRVHLQYDPLY